MSEPLICEVPECDYAARPGLTFCQGHIPLDAASTVYQDALRGPDVSEPLTAEERATLNRIADDVPVWMGDDGIASFPHPGSAAGRDVLTVFEVLPRLLATLDAARPSGEVDVERLRKAMTNVGVLRTTRLYAEKIATEYAALDGRREETK